MFGVVEKNYSVPMPLGFKLVDEGGQGSGRSVYGKTLEVTAADLVNLYVPDNSVPYGAVRANRTPWFRLLDMGGLVAAPVLFFLGRKSAAAVVLGLVVADVAVRHASPNFDAMMSMLPFNRAAEV